MGPRNATEMGGGCRSLTDAASDLAAPGATPMRHSLRGAAKLRGFGPAEKRCFAGGTHLIDD
jgi:hypothetical protein